MSLRTLILADPFNATHLSSLEQFEKELNLDDNISSTLKKIKEENSKESYEASEKSANETDSYLLLSVKGKTTSCAKLHNYKDVKTSYIAFVVGDRTIIPLVTEYAFAALSSYDVFATVEESDKKSINALLDYGYESLGLDNKKETFVKEREIMKGIKNEVTK